LKKYSVLLVVLGAALWGTDSLFRTPLSREFSPVSIVLLEHCLLSALMLPFLSHGSDGRARMRAPDLWALLFIAVGGSVTATSIFTYAIKYGNPTVVVVLQKTQPLFVVLLARAFLGERPQQWFWACLIPALVGAYLVSFPDWRSGLVADPHTPWSILAALSAALLWGASTVLGRYLLARITVLRLTALRFLFALPVLGALYFLQPAAAARLPSDAASVWRLVSMALFSSLAGLLLYYKGLQATRASVASVAEMAFPLTAVVANWLILHVRLTPSQMGGAAMLVASITALTYFNARTANHAVTGTRSHRT